MDFFWKSVEKFSKRKPISKWNFFNHLSRRNITTAALIAIWNPDNSSSTSRWMFLVRVSYGTPCVLLNCKCLDNFWWHLTVHSVLFLCNEANLLPKCVSLFAMNFEIFDIRTLMWIVNCEWPLARPFIICCSDCNWNYENLKLSPFFTNENNSNFKLFRLLKRAFFLFWNAGYLSYLLFYQTKWISNRIQGKSSMNNICMYRFYFTQKNCSCLSNSYQTRYFDTFQ